MSFRPNNRSVCIITDAYLHTQDNRQQAMPLQCLSGLQHVTTPRNNGPSFKLAWRQRMSKSRIQSE